ncbi:MAG TPA: hypothetical protein VGL44_09015 [Gaiellales bacterium]|jgi:hypothetical protein
MRGRLLGTALLALVASGIAVGTADAYWSAPGAGQGSAGTGAVGRPAGIDTSVHGDVAATSFDVTWSLLPVPEGVSLTYVVHRRIGATVVDVCTTSAGRCTLSGVPDGSSSYSVTARLNGWTGATSTSTPIKVVTTPPAITAHPPSSSTATTASFTFTHPNFGSFACRIDAGVVAACASPALSTGLAVGTHTFEVWAADADGALTRPATSTWTIT